MVSSDQRALPVYPGSASRSLHLPVSQKSYAMREKSVLRLASVSELHGRDLPGRIPAYGNLFLLTCTAGAPSTI